MKKTIILTLALSITALMMFSQERQPGPNKIGIKGPLSTLVVTELDGTTLTATNLVEAILGTGVSYSNVNYIGTLAPVASAGTYTNGNGAGLDIDQGVILSSGYVMNARGPNIEDGITGILNLAGDSDLDALIPGYGTFDATVLEFDFIPTATTIYIEYIFGSDEYNEFVNSSYNDVFAFFVNGVNIALIPNTNTPVAIDNVNNGYPYGDLCTNCAFYNNNDLDDGGPFFDIEADGFTAKFTGQIDVTPDVNNHIKIAIADAGDHSLDSWVFIKAGSFSVNNPDVPISSWALFIGLGLIIAFTVIRYKKFS